MMNIEKAKQISPHDSAVLHGLPENYSELIEQLEYAQIIYLRKTT